ncbi:MAG: metallopeptidase TldD-related protein [Pseudomonadota bacterium]
MTQSLSHLAEALIHAATQHGADAADAVTVSSDSLSVEVRNGALEQAERSEGTEIGLRVFVGQRSASVSASDTRQETIETLAERAVAMARLAPEDPYAGLADPDQLAASTDAGALDLVDEIEPDPKALEVTALACEAAAMAVPGVMQMDGASGNYGAMRFHMAATNGFSAGYARTSHSASAVAISGEGLKMERDYAFDSRTHLADMISAEEIGTLAGERAVALQNPSRPPTGAYPVLYDERVSGSLIGHLVQAINGSAIARGASWLKDAMGEAVLPAGMDLVEEPHRARTSGSRPFDGEGLATASRSLVTAGVLQGWTLDLATARKLGLSSTANANRGVTGAPSPGLSNLRLTQGEQDRDALLREMGTGLLITSLIGSSVNSNTGDYSRGASGFWVENGEIVRPVNECTVAGNLREMLMSLTAANDARPHLSRVIPSLRVEGLTIAGS